MLVPDSTGTDGLMDLWEHCDQGIARDACVCHLSKRKLHQEEEMESQNQQVIAHLSTQ